MLKQRLLEQSAAAALSISADAVMVTMIPAFGSIEETALQSLVFSDNCHHSIAPRWMALAALRATAK